MTKSYQFSSSMSTLLKLPNYSNRTTSQSELHNKLGFSRTKLLSHLLSLPHNLPRPHIQGEHHVIKHKLIVMDV